MARQDVQGIELLQAHERSARLRDSLRRVDVGPGLLRCVARKDDPELGDPDREVILRVAGRVDERERQVAAVDRKPLVADSDVRWCEHESVEPARLLLLHLRARRDRVAAAERSAHSACPMMGAG